MWNSVTQKIPAQCGLHYLVNTFFKIRIFGVRAVANRRPAKSVEAISLWDYGCVTQEIPAQCGLHYSVNTL